tara:strand:- start:610 stop:738 length:129 start_codon:yes stop_codon:yes gene_type:complete
MSGEIASSSPFGRFIAISKGRKTKRPDRFLNLSGLFNLVILN